ncbi:MAG: NPCBM/NEW2 domain-containing protein [Candidatus Nealsonbacteria bacterium]|nr:NPCBM/NEW2 domain-containing protein [Candidatus Nealsonbacteria bacterium]
MSTATLRITAMLFLAAGTLPIGASAAETVWLDELDMSRSTSGWGSTQRNKSVDGGPLKIAGKSYQHGVGTHPPGAIRVALDGGSTRFTALVGIDDEVGQAGTAEFLVFGDGKQLFKSPVMRGGQPPHKVDVDVRGVKKLDLVVTVAGDGFGHDHTDWLEARFEVTGTRPKTTGLPVRSIVGGPELEDVTDEPLARFISLHEQMSQPWRANVIEQAYRPESTILDTDLDPVDIVLRRARALLNHLRTMPNAPDLSREQAELAKLSEHSGTIDVENTDARIALFREVWQVRRRIAFSNPLLSFDRLLLIKRHFNPNAETTGNHMCDQFFGFHARPGGGLFVLQNPFSDKPVLKNILENAAIGNGRLEGQKMTSDGAYLSPELSFDAKHILFAYTDTTKEPRHSYTWNEDNTWHIFRVNVDGSGLVQLTDGAWNDFDPCYLPNGRIAFISERRGGYGRCHGRPVPSFTLHSMNYDGSDIVMLSPHETNEWQPSVDHNGMIVYTRWDYVDRGFNQAHHPWITTPDGRDSRVIHGNFAANAGQRPHFEADIRAIPGSPKLVATAACHHGQAYGSLVIVDPKVADDDAMAPVRRLTPDQLFPESECATHRGPANYATAWPLSEDFYLCVYDAFSKSNAGEANNYGVYLIDSFGNRDLIYRDPNISCLNPVPLRPRTRPPVVPQKTLVGKALAPGEKFVASDPDKLPKTATVNLVNVYDSVLPWPDNTQIKAVRIVQLLPKTTPFAHNPAIGYGSQKGARAILGTVPVESDGSASFLLPINIPVCFQALDGDGLAVQMMRSATYVHAGETLTCQGCHEPRHLAPKSPSQTPLAMRRAPSRIRPDIEGSKPFSFPRLVQPVLDRRCVECHAKEPKAFDLSAGDVAGNRGKFYPSYNNLRPYAFYFDNAAFTTPTTIPGKYGARASKLYEILKKGHYDVKLSTEEFHRITLWLDSNSDFFGSYENCEAQAHGEVVQPTLE